MWIVSGKANGTSFLLTEKGLTIGRDGKNDIMINNTSVSSKHCWIVPLDERVYCMDKGSANGTYVNNSKINKVEIFDGDTISLGKKSDIKLMYKK